MQRPLFAWVVRCRYDEYVPPAPGVLCHGPAPAFTRNAALVAAHVHSGRGAPLGIDNLALRCV